MKMFTGTSGIFWRVILFACLPALTGTEANAQSSERASSTSKWVDGWAVSYLPTKVNGTFQGVPTFSNQTLRLNMFMKLGGSAVRVKVSNRLSTQPLVIGGVHVALRR